jgi:hypothetical protein
VDPITIAALLGLGGKALEVGVSAWKAWLDSGRGGVAVATDGKQYALPHDGQYLTPAVATGRRALREQVSFELRFFPGDPWAQAYLSRTQPVLLVIEEQNPQSRIDSIVAIGALGDGFSGSLPPGHYLLGVYVFLDSDPETWDDVDGGSFVEFSVARSESPFSLAVPVFGIQESVALHNAPKTVDFETGMLTAGSQHAYAMLLNGLVTYRVWVQSLDSAADFDLAVLDENGNLIAVDDHPASDAICEFTPRWTGEFCFVVSCHQGTSAYELLIQV